MAKQVHLYVALQGHAPDKLSKITVVLLCKDHLPPGAAQRRTWLSKTAWVDFEPTFLSAGEGQLLFDVLLERVEWEQREIQLFGRRVLQPRLLAWAGDLPYRYSRQTLEPRPLPPFVTDLAARVRKRASVPFNHVLFNRYRTGQDAMGMHADDEPELGKNPTLASVSLGATRRFHLVRRRSGNGQRRVTLELTHASLLIMGGSLQHEYRHGVPRQAKQDGQRLNLTFRHLLSIPPP
jgi:alkylated DNA repair dioxygenase AlkB